MEDISIEAIKKQVAQKHKLGKTLVTGHLCKYWEEVVREHTRLHLEAAMRAIIENADIVCRREEKGIMSECKACMGGGCEDSVISKVSILNAYPIENIK